MVPGDERQAPAVRAGPWIGHEVAALEQHLARIAGLPGQPYDGVSRLARAGMVLAHGRQATAGQGGGVGVAIALRGHRLDLAVRSQQVQLLVGEV